MEFSDSDEFESFSYSTAQDIPPATRWTPICSFMGLTLSKVPSIKKYYLNDWEVTIMMPILVNLIILSSYGFAMFVLIPKLDFMNTFLTLGFTALVILFDFSYNSIYLTGPGYLDYFYPLQPKSATQNGPDYLSGLVTNEEQRLYVEQSRGIARAKFFKSAKRIVMRPDHFCVWTATFIGKRNHKLFFLFNFWGMIYISCFLGLDITYITRTFTVLNVPPSVPVGLMYIILAFMFLLMTSMFAISSGINICKNTTQIEKYQRVRHQSRGLVANLTEVFGPTKRWYTWLLPIPAFPMKECDPEMLIPKNL